MGRILAGGRGALRLEAEWKRAGDSAIILYLRGTTPEEAAVRMRQLLEQVDREWPSGLVDATPALSSLLLSYDPLQTTADELHERLSELSITVADVDRVPEVREIPVLYGGEAGADLSEIANAAGLSEQQVIELHSSQEYTVLFLGFTPGFPYMGPLPSQLRTPRLVTPRVEVPAGSVALAEDQTAIYPVASPGGWKLIGRTPLRLFDARNTPPALLRPGDRVRFVPVDTASYSRIHFKVLGGRA